MPCHDHPVLDPTVSKGIVVNIHSPLKHCSKLVGFYRSPQLCSKSNIFRNYVRGIFAERLYACAHRIIRMFHMANGTGRYPHGTHFIYRTKQWKTAPKALQTNSHGVDNGGRQIFARLLLAGIYRGASNAHTNTIHFPFVSLNYAIFCNVCKT